MQTQSLQHRQLCRRGHQQVLSWVRIWGERAIIHPERQERRWTEGIRHLPAASTEADVFSLILRATGVRALAWEPGKAGSSSFFYSPFLCDLRQVTSGLTSQAVRCPFYLPGDKHTDHCELL